MRPRCAHRPPSCDAPASCVQPAVADTRADAGYLSRKQLIGRASPRERLDPGTRGKVLRHWLAQRVVSRGLPDARRLPIPPSPTRVLLGAPPPCPPCHAGAGRRKAQACSCPPPVPTPGALHLHCPGTTGTGRDALARSGWVIVLACFDRVDHDVSHVCRAGTQRRTAPALACGTSSSAPLDLRRGSQRHLESP